MRIKHVFVVNKDINFRVVDVWLLLNK